MSLLGRLFGAIRDDADPRDHRFLLSHPEAAETPLDISVDLSADLPPAWHQGGTSSCTAQASAALMAYLYPGFMPSRLQVYYATRALEHTTDRDGGCQIRNAMKALQKVGAIPEAAWPFDEGRVTDPPPADGERWTIAAYSRLASETEMLSCLALRHPFVLAVQIPETLDREAGRTGVMTLPTGKPDMIGMHAMLCCGYDLDFRINPAVAAAGIDPRSVDSTALLLRNSWGAHWGLPSNPGYFWLPMSWATNPSTGGDCWTGHKLVTTASEPAGPTVAGVPIQGHFQS